MTTYRLRPSALCVAAVLALAPLASQAGNRFCGPGFSSSAEDDPNQRPSDLSMEYLSQQPAGIITCALGYWAEKCGDHETAHKVFDKCIAAGYAGAMIWKALLYEDGTGIEQSSAKAAELLLRAANSGQPGYSTLGKLHYASALYEGRGVPQNKEEAMKWFQAAADEGDPDAREFLATGYHTASRDQSGHGVGTQPPDLVAATPTATNASAGEAAEAVQPKTIATSQPQAAPHAVRAIALSHQATQPTPAPSPTPAAPPPADAPPPTGLHLAQVSKAIPTYSRGAFTFIAAMLLAALSGAVRQWRRPSLSRNTLFS